MDQRKLLLVVGTACFVVFVIVLVPASIVTSVIPDDTMKIGGISGTVWNGRARVIEVANVQLTGTRWELHPLHLLLGRLALTVETQMLGNSIDGEVRVGITGTTSVRNLNSVGPLGPVTRLMNIPQGGGDLNVRIDELTIRDAWPTVAVGVVRIGNLPLNIIGVAAGPTGSYEVAFTADPVPDDGRVVGELTDLGGPLSLSGQIAFDPPNSYELTARVKGAAGAPSDLVRGLALLGPADADGNHELTMTGSL